MTTANPRLDRVDIGAALNLAGPAERWLATGITLPDDPLEEISVRLVWSANDDYQTGLFTVGRILNDLADAVPGTERTGGGGLTAIELTRLGASAAEDYYLGHTDEAELLVLGPTTAHSVGVELWTFRAEDVRAEDLADAARLRLLPTPTEATRGHYLRQSPDGETYELVDDGPTGFGAAYATFADVQASGSTNADREELYERLLLSASRLIDRELDMMPGGFAPIDHRTFHFRGSGRRRLRLRDAQGQMYPLRSVDADGIRPDYDGTGNYESTDYSWDLEDAWVWPTVIDAVAIGRPIYGLELRRINAAPLTIWPTRERSVQITGDWGWAEVPDPIRELAIGCARQAADAHQGGLAAVADGFDEAVMLGGDAWRLWDRVRQEYGTRSKRGGMPVGFRS